MGKQTIDKNALTYTPTDTHANSKPFIYSGAYNESAMMQSYTVTEFVLYVFPVSLFSPPYLGSRRFSIPCEKFAFVSAMGEDSVQ